MSMPLDNRVPEDHSSIDRLVDGELPDSDRRELLLRLDTEAGGWRRCALAFLEAQTWHDAFGALPATDRALPQSVMIPDTQGQKPNAWFSVARLTALAAGLVAAFAIGWGLNTPKKEGQSPFLAENTPDAVIASAGTSPLAPISKPLEPAPFDLGAVVARPAKPPEALALLDPLVKQWEQRGYRAERQKRLISMELNDGRRLEVPIQEVRLQYIGGRTY